MLAAGPMTANFSHIFTSSSNIVTVHIGQLLDELGPVLAPHLDHGRVESVMLHLDMAAFSRLSEALVEIVPCCFRVAIWAHDSHDQVRLLLYVLHRDYQWLVLILLLESLASAVHDEVSELLEGERVLEELRVSQVTILEDAVAEVLGHLDLVLVDQAVAHSDDGLLHVLGELDATPQQRHIVLTQVESIVGGPEVVMEAPLDEVELGRGRRLLPCKTWLLLVGSGAIGVHVFRIGSATL